MRWGVSAVLAAALCLIGLLDVVPANAEVVIVINKSTQRLHVLVDGSERYVWKTSTGTRGGPKNGTYRPERMERTWFSRKFGMSPMPHSIFFHEGYAIHGTIYVSRLGNRASHGCVRLHPDNAAILFELVRSQGMSNTRIVVSNNDYASSKAGGAPAAGLR
jgi:lipoprotein-anchoring transpeptidase ErfK/SrfK